MARRRPNETVDPTTLLSCFSYGVGHDEKEGICLGLKIGPYHVLLDCGIADLEQLQEDRKAFDFALCSHAHSDHARGFLALQQRFPRLPIYASEVTARLLSLNWLDCRKATDFCRPLPWRSPLELLEGLTVELLPAGHLPGATVFVLTYATPQRSYRVVYTGDFSLSNLQLVEGLSLEHLRGLSPDVLIVEGSYGTRRYPHRRQQEKQLMQRIDRALSEGNSVLLPVPILGLGQEILKLLRSHHQFTGRNVDIWVTERLGQACDIYLELLPQLPISVQNFAKHQPLFWDDRIYPRLRRLAKTETTLGKNPCVLLVEADRELAQYYPLSPCPWLVLIPEFLCELTAPPRARSDATWETYLLAEHSDGRNTTQLIHNLRPQHVVFVHGSPADLADLTALEELQTRYQLHAPARGMRVNLPLGERFLQPAAPTATRYEGELNELGSSVTLTLPIDLTLDSRWSQFADTGLVEGRWQGEELVLRGISQRELIGQRRESLSASQEDCCQTCRFYRPPRCWNPRSPLHGFKVTPDGLCPVFEAIPGPPQEFLQPDADSQEPE
jgi:Cft2 family RNA processing exonuclease